MSRDVTTFLAYIAEPETEVRKRLGADGERLQGVFSIKRQSLGGGRSSHISELIKFNSQLIVILSECKRFVDHR